MSATNWEVLDKTGFESRLGRISMTVLVNGVSNHTYTIPPRSFDGSSPNLVGECRWTLELPLRGSFSKRSMGQRVNGSLSLSTILYVPASHYTAAKGAFCFAATASKSLI